MRSLAEDRDLPIGTDDQLREQGLTDQWLDDRLQALKRVWADFDLVLPDGASSAYQRRVGGVLEDFRIQHGSDERILVSSHGNAIGL